MGHIESTSWKVLGDEAVNEPAKGAPAVGRRELDRRVELTRFRGHLNLWKVRESRNAQNKTAVPV